MKRLFEDIESMIEAGLDDYDISNAICSKYGASLEEDNWLSNQICNVRRMKL